MKKTLTLIGIQYEKIKLYLVKPNRKRGVILASNISSIETIERYLDNQEKIQPLLESIMETLSDGKMLRDRSYQESVLKNISKVYPYLDMIYSLSESGEQLLDTTLSPKGQRKLKGLSDKSRWLFSCFSSN